MHRRRVQSELYLESLQPRCMKYAWASPVPGAMPGSQKMGPRRGFLEKNVLRRVPLDSLGNFTGDSLHHGPADSKSVDSPASRVANCQQKWGIRADSRGVLIAQEIGIERISRALPQCGSAGSDPHLAINSQK
jgi:hypothetical protein